MAAATLALSKSKMARASTTSKVAIVGGGISGLAAALTLADHGFASTVYEASGRIGGRMYSNTNYWDNGQVSEWGGELIDSGHQTVRTLAKRFNLPLVDLLQAEPNGSEDTYFFNGVFYPKADANNDFQAVHNALQGDVAAASYPTLYNLSTPGGQALDQMSIYDWIESRVPGGHRSAMGQLLDVAYVIEYGADTHDQSALNLVYLLGYKAAPGQFKVFGASDERFHIVGGNQQLPTAISNYLGAGAVQTGWRMTSIALTAGGRYDLSFSTPSTQVVTADVVILAMPFAVLRTLSYGSAGFDTRKDLAIRTQGAGRNGKLHLQFTQRMWNATGAWPGISNGLSYSDTGYQNTWDVTRGQPGVTGILIDYTGGAPTLGMTTQVPWGTMATAGVSTDANRFLGQVAPVFPGLAQRWNKKATSSLPHLDPNLKLSYSYWKVGQYTTIAGYEKAPQGNVFFAGEHTSVDFQGFMEGGASEGIRAANEALAALGVK